MSVYWGYGLVFTGYVSTKKWMHRNLWEPKDANYKNPIKKMDANKEIADSFGHWVSQWKRTEGKTRTPTNYCPFSGTGILDLFEISLRFPCFLIWKQKHTRLVRLVETRHNDQINLKSWSKTSQPERRKVSYTECPLHHNFERLWNHWFPRRGMYSLYQVYEFVKPTVCEESENQEYRSEPCGIPSAPTNRGVVLSAFKW